MMNRRELNSSWLDMPGDEMTTVVEIVDSTFAVEAVQVIAVTMASARMNITSKSVHRSCHN